MLSFAICDDNKEYLSKLKKLVYRFVINMDTEYSISTFTKYEKDFRNFAKADKGFKVYILDIEAGATSGLDAARYIRETCDDWVSIIIIVTAYPQYKYEALSNRLYLLDFVSKLDDCDNNLNTCLETVKKLYNNRQQVFSYEFNHIVHKVEYRHIICIEKEQDSKRCIIKTTYGNQNVISTLNEVYNKLSDDHRFVKVSRSLIVNVDYIKEYNAQDGRIIFNNGDSTILITRKNKLELRKRVRNS